MLVLVAIVIRSIKLRRMRWVDMQHARKNTGVPTRSWLEIPEGMGKYRMAKNKEEVLPKL